MRQLQQNIHIKVTVVQPQQTGSHGVEAQMYSLQREVLDERRFGEAFGEALVDKRVQVRRVPQGVLEEVHAS